MTKKKLVRMIPYTEEWEKKAGQIARQFCPRIYPCTICGFPVITGYCCTNTTCQNTDPSEQTGIDLFKGIED